MARKSAAEYLGETLDHEDETAEHRTIYPGAKEESVLESNNKHVTEFREKLNDINEQAAAAFDNREDIGGYSETNREKIIASHLKAFNQVEFNGNANDRLEAANDIAGTIFKPMHDRIAIDMLQSQHNMDPNLVSAMREAGVEHVDVMNIKDASGNTSLKFTVKDQDAADKIAKQFEGQVHVVTDEDPRGYTSTGSNVDKIIEDYQSKFADTLNMTDGKDEAIAAAAAEHLFKLFNEAHEYSTKQRIEESTQHQVKTEEEFSELSNQDEILQYLEVDRTVRDTWKETLETLNQMHWNLDPRYDGANEIYKVIDDVHREGIYTTLDNKDFANFERIADRMQKSQEDFSQAFKNDTGFVKLEDYDRQHVLPEKFEDVDQVREYSDRIGDHLEEIGDQNEAGDNYEHMSSMAYHVAEQLKVNFDKQLQDIGTKENAGTDTTDEYITLYKTGQGLEYILKSKEEKENEEPDEAESLTEKVATVGAKVLDAAGDAAAVGTVIAAVA